MDIQRCFEILEIDDRASIDEVKRAYKDIVNVWHPDRFSNNPRLKQRAERKLKEINVAYEIVNSFLASSKASGPDEKGSPLSKAGTVDYAGRKEGTPFSHVKSYSEERDTVEMVAEAGTRMVLSLWSYVSRKLQQFANSADFKMEEQDRPGSNDHE